MPDDREPGVFVEETRWPRAPITGVTTTTAAFVGPTLVGPADLEPVFVTSLADFERAFGDGQPLTIDGAPADNYLWHAARGFFDQGGLRLCVVRVRGELGARHTPAAYAAGLATLEPVDEVATVAAPGATRDYERQPTPREIVAALVDHAQRARYRIAVIDSGDGQTPDQVRAMRATIDSSWAALYYPWVRIDDPVSGNPRFVPPSGFVAGIYADTDIRVGVSKAPANETIRLATGLEVALDRTDQEALGAASVNCLRTFPGRGTLVWGARTLSSDPDWKYVNIRRLFAFLEHSIDAGLQWTVFEPNGEPLWGEVRRSVEDFLFAEWRAGALLGSRAEEAFFVRCDRSTMTQDDIDNGRLVCEVGVAPLRPAEFVIFRIGKSTAGRP